MVVTKVVVVTAPRVLVVPALVVDCGALSPPQVYAVYYIPSALNSRRTMMFAVQGSAGKFGCIKGELDLLDLESCRSINSGKC